MKKNLLYVLCYVLWFITVALGLYNLLSIRGLYLLILEVGALKGSFNPWAISAADKFAFLILAVIFLAFVIYCESYYRVGVIKSKLWRRFSLITGGQFILLFLINIIPIILYHELYTLGYNILGYSNTIIIIVAEFFVGIILLFLAFRPPLKA